ncbi:MAG: hypothetical protein H5U02_03880 [Clostridia bacterium]|nr:hypothetical protein [Clostridia bacterium]
MRKQIAMLILGAIIGMAVTAIRVGGQVDVLWIENSRLLDELRSRTERLRLLEAQISKQCYLRVTSVEPHVSLKRAFNSAEAQSICLAVERQIAEILSPLLGKEVKSLDPTLVMQILDQRRVQVNKQNYELLIKTLILSERLVVYVEAKPLAIAMDS